MALIDGGLAETPARFLVAAAATRYGRLCKGEGRPSVLAFGSQWTGQSCQSEPNPVHARSYSPPYESTMALLFVIYRDLGILVWGATYAAQTLRDAGLASIRIPETRMMMTRTSEGRISQAATGSAQAEPSQGCSSQLPVQLWGEGTRALDRWLLPSSLSHTLNPGTVRWLVRE